MKLFHTDAYKDLKKRLNKDERDVIRNDWSVIQEAEEKANAVESQLDANVPFDVAADNVFRSFQDDDEHHRLILKVLRNTWFYGQKLHKHVQGDDH